MAYVLVYVRDILFRGALGQYFSTGSMHKNVVVSDINFAMCSILHKTMSRLHVR